MFCRWCNEHDVISCMHMREEAALGIEPGSKGSCITLKTERVAADPQDDFVCPVEWKEYHGHDGTKVLCPYTLDKRINWWELKGKKGTLTFREDNASDVEVHSKESK